MENSIKKDYARLRLFKKYGYGIPKARRFILAKAKFIKGGGILEIGTGRGHMALVLAKKGLKFTSIDLDKKAQRTARFRLKEIKRNKLAALKIMNAQELRYKDNSFDNVISVNFIHHAKNPVRCLKEMVRVAKDKLIIADINKRGERIMEKVHGLDGHRHEKSKMSLRETKAMLKKTGMKVKVYRDACQTVLIATKGASK